MSKTKGSTYLMSARLVAVAMQFVAIPLYLRLVGANGYGLVIIVTTWRMWAGVLDLDVPVGALSYQARQFAQSWDAGVRAHRTTLGLHLTIGLVGLVALTALGPVLPAPKAMVRGETWHLMFALAGAQFLFEYLSNGINIAYMARQEFQRVATIGALVSACGIAISVPAVIVFRTPQSIAAGMTLGAAAGLLANLLLVRWKEPALPLVPAFDWGESRQILRLGAKNYANNCLGKLAKTADKLILGSTLGLSAVGFYATCTKIPELLNDLLSRISDSALPEMARRSIEPDTSFSPLVRRNVLVMATVAASTIPVICAFGTSLLKLWQGSRFDALAGGFIVAVTGIYYSFELLYGLYARALLSKNKMQVALPFVGFNALVTLFLTGPLSRRFGLPGVACMNLGIDVMQFVPLTILVLRAVAPAARPFEVLARTSCILLVGFGLSAGLFWTDRSWLMVSAPILSVAGAVLCVWVALKLLAYARLSVTPGLLSGVFRRVGIEGAKDA